MKNFAWIFLVLALSYALQLFLTGYQAKRYYRRMRELRKNGIPSVGIAGSKWSGRTFAVLVADNDLNIVNAEVLSGYTIFANLKPVDQLLGHNIRDLLDQDNTFDLKKKILAAFRNSAEHYVNEEGELVPIVKETIDKSLKPS
ncbi:MAG: transcriptional regulator [Anaerolineaceae bacterium]|nr:transcriptional regulator [Anaerolineaceae bacterium]